MANRFRLRTAKLVTADDRYIRDSILLPAKQISAGYENIMPSYSGQLARKRSCSSSPI